MTIPLTKTLSPLDYEELMPELHVVDAHFDKDRPQHERRRWEYAMALRALAEWRNGKDYREPARVADVGGAGSPFWRMLDCRVHEIDPDSPPNLTLQQYLTTTRQLEDETHPLLFPSVFCLSVLEHVDDLDQFLFHLSCLVAPGGLLFLTMDCCGCDRLHNEENYPDRHHFHWMRKRLFTIDDRVRVMHSFILGIGRERSDFSLFGEADFTYYGDTVYDYSFASLALVKRA